MQNLAEMLEVVCGVIENEVGEFLACLRPPGKHLAGLWEFPGGKIEADESPEQALIRELDEELAIEIKVAEPLGPVIWHYESLSIRLSPFLCHIVSGHLQLRAHAAYRWLSPNDFGDLPWAAADLPILAEIRSRRGDAS
jgi:8-oxo-dGTP diphosphatase